MSSDEDKEREYLRDLRDHCEESLRLLQNHPWMEKICLKAFLRMCGIKFKDDELIRTTKCEEPPDVRFRNANFELTECMDKHQRTGDEYKSKIREIEQAGSLLDLGWAPDNSIPMEFSELLGHVKKGMDRKFAKYSSPKTCGDLDLLVYLNLHNRHLNPQSKTRRSREFLAKVKRQGWRSISFLMNHCAGVIFSKRDSPDFIRNLGRDVRWWMWPGGQSAFED